MLMLSVALCLQLPGNLLTVRHELRSLRSPLVQLTVRTPRSQPIHTQVGHSYLHPKPLLGRLDLLEVLDLLGPQRVFKVIIGKGVLGMGLSYVLIWECSNLHPLDGRVERIRDATGVEFGHDKHRLCYLVHEGVELVVDVLCVLQLFLSRQ